MTPIIAVAISTSGLTVYGLPATSILMFAVIVAMVGVWVVVHVGKKEQTR